MMKNNSLSELNESIAAQIDEFIKKQNFFQAKKLIKGYRSLNPSNIELYSIEAVLAIAEGNMTTAEQILRMGLELDVENRDLLFNLGYVYESKGQFKKAKEYYLKAKCYANDELNTEIDGILANLIDREGEGNEKIQELILNKPLVSVIIATYNLKNYLKETIDSLLAQDFADLEIIVGDDCSTDGTDELMEQYRSNPKIRYIRNSENLGSSENYKTLLYEQAQGKYVLAINHDDYLIANDYISRAVAVLEANPEVNLVFAKAKFINMQTGQTGDLVVTDIPQKIKGIDYFLHYQSQAFPPIPSTLTSIFRRDAALKIGCFLEEVYSQDTFLYLKLMLTGDVAFINEFVGVYRIHEKSLTHNMPIEKDLTTIEEFERIYYFALAKGINQEKLGIWLNTRVLNYVVWRFTNLWPVNKKYGLELLLSVSDRYRIVFDSVMSHLHWK